MKKLLTLLLLTSMFFIIFLLPIASSLDLDNVKIYDPDSKTVGIKNAFGFGDELARVRLDSPLDQRVSIGYQKVAQMTFINFERGSNGLGKMEFFDLKKGNKKIDRQFDYKYKKIVSVQEDVYDLSCANNQLLNGSASRDCSKVKTGKQIVQKEEWVKFTNPNQLPSGEVVVGIFTEVQKGDRVEWIPTFFGKEINEWAVWTEDLNVNLVAYYDFEESSGNLIDIFNGTYNHTLFNTPIQQAEGIIDFGYKFASASSERTEFSGAISQLSGDNPFTLNFWYNTTANQQQTIVSLGASGDGNRFVRIGFASNVCGINTTLSVSGNDGIGDKVKCDTIATNDGDWHMGTVIYNSSRAFTLYRDGNLVGGTTNFGQALFSSQNQYCHGALCRSTDTEFFTGNIDESSLWNRTLTSSEITQLYNDGLGINPNINFVVTLISPADNSEISSPSQVFNATLEPAGGATNVNATLWVWHINGTLFNNSQTVSVGGTSINSGAINLTNIPLGQFTWNILGVATNSTGDALNQFAPNNFTFTKGGNFISFEEESPVLETLSSRFAVNVTTGSGINVQSAILSYNGTNFTATDKTEVSDGNFSIIKTINIPSGVSGFSQENRSFSWIITLVDEISGATFTQQSSQQSQIVNELSFALCDASIIHAILNFTMFDEITGDLINGTNNATTFQATFNIGASPDSLIKNYSISNVSVSTNEFDFCTNQTTNNLYVNMDAFFTAVDYSDKSYQLSGANLSTEENEISLFLLLDSETIQFFVDVVRDLVGVPNAIVQVAKFFVGEGVYKTVEITQTDNDGSFTSNLELDKPYRFTVIEDGEVSGIVEKTSSCQSAPCTLTLDITSSTLNIYTGYYSAFAQNVVYNLTWDALDRIVEFDFVDTSGLATSFRMDILRLMPNQSNIVINSQTLFTSSGSMTFNATGQPDGDYIVETYISRSPALFIDSITFFLSGTVSTIGMTGLIVVFVMMIVMVMAFAISPVFLILAVPFSLTFLKLIGVFALPFSGMALIWLLAGFLAWLVGNR